MADTAAAITTFLRRRARECAGAVLTAAGLLLMAVLVRYDESDASGATVTSINGDEYSNLLGAAGAEVAALVVQYPGPVAGWAFALLLIIRGVRLLRHDPWRPSRARLVMILPALLLVSFAGGTIGLGGGIGGAFITSAASLIGQLPPLTLPAATPEAIAALNIGWGHIAASLLGLVAFGSFVYAAAIGRAELRIFPFFGRWLWRVVLILLTPFLFVLSRFARKPIGDDAASDTAMAREQSHDDMHDALPARKSAGMKSRLAAMMKSLAALFHPGESTALPKPARRKTPRARREPVMVSSESGEDDAPGRTAPRRRKSGFGAALDLATPSGYHLPPRDLLSPPQKGDGLPTADKEVLDNNSRMLESVLAEFGVRGEIRQARFGPVVTRYELVLAPGIKTQRVIALADDIARSMAALSVRIAVVPGQNVIGIELPNADRRIVLMRDILDGDEWGGQSGTLPLALGMDIAGKPVIADLARMPHLLVAGTTGSGKSVGINGMILSLLYTHTPETCRFIMIDPKMLELSVYDGIPHLLTPVVTDPGKAVTALKWTVREMESRYRNMSKLGVRNIDGYNQRLADARRKGETLTKRAQTGFDSDTGLPVYEEQDLDLTPLPFIVVVIDEVADLMLVAGKDIEAAVQRLAQMARAAGIHVVMATQRPSVDVITGTIKANFPTRISFQVTSKIDSRTILGEQGGEQLLGKGDMLFMEGGGRIIRVHGPFIEDREVEAVTNFLREQGEPVYDDNVTTEAEAQDGDAVNGAGNGNGGDGGDDASLYDQAVSLVTREGKASTSFIQRHLRIGYNRAATIIEDMERNGVVSPANHAGKREVLIQHDN